MTEEAARARRFQAFEESLKNSRDYKITDMQRGFRDLKSRLDAIEGEKTSFLGLTYKSFCDVDRKLAELADLQMMVERAQSTRAASRCSSAPWRLPHSRSPPASFFSSLSAALVQPDLARRPVGFCLQPR